ncbi:MAG: RDD family protein [Bacteroidota bacterium]
MTKIKITTTQHIDIEYELASVFDRILAWLVDFMIIIGYLLVAMSIVQSVNPDADRGAMALVALPIFFYHLVMEWMFNGRSVGKMALRLRVIRLDGSPPNVGNYLMRWIFRLLETNPALFYGIVAIGSVAISEKGQRIGDMLAGTTVIRTQRKVGIQDTIFARTGSDYEPVFPAVAGMNDRDAGTVKDVLRMYRRERDPKLLNICANRVCHVLEIVPPKAMTSEQFLRHVLRDYSHLN